MPPKKGKGRENDYEKQESTIQLEELCFNVYGATLYHLDDYLIDIRLGIKTGFLSLTILTEIPRLL